MRFLNSTAFAIVDARSNDLRDAPGFTLGIRMESPALTRLKPSMNEYKNAFGVHRIHKLEISLNSVAEQEVKHDE